HQHAQKKGRSLISKILLYLFLFWIGSTALSALFLTSFQLSDRIWGYGFLAVIGYAGYKLYKRFYKKSPSISPIIGNYQEVSNLQLNGKVNIPNPYAGVFISGGAGAGKSKSIIEPIINDAGKKGFTGVIYDFKFPELANYVNTAYSNGSVKPYFINFTDLSRSHRINPIAPELMINDSFAREFAYSILANLNPSMISKPDFWSENSTALLASVFWYLKKKHPQYCTLPHAMSMILQPDLESLLNTLDKEQKCADMIAPIMTAYANKADNQLAGVISSLQISLSKINTEEVYYLTSKS